MMQWITPQHEAFEALWELMDDTASVLSGIGNITLCVNQSKNYTLVAVDPTEQGE